MRWDEQRVEEQSERSLPGLTVDAVRTFDAPEALGIRFHEVRAKSALNHVPKAPYGFNWTINLFRDCTCAARFATSSSAGFRPSAPTCYRATNGSTPAAPTFRPRNESG